MHAHTHAHTRWLEYVFGICKPDQRIGKRGSRCFSMVLAACYHLRHCLLAIWNYTIFS